MRLTPVPMYFAATPPKPSPGPRTVPGRPTRPRKQSTHAAKSPGCRSARCGASTTTRSCPRATAPSKGYGTATPLAEKIARVANGSSKDRHPPNIKGTGYVVDTIEAALWVFHNSEAFREGALLAVSLGDDADTTGATYGQLAGAHYGAETVPASWRAKLTMLTEITSLADQLHYPAALAPEFQECPS